MAISASSSGNGLDYSGSGLDLSTFSASFRFRYDGTTGNSQAKLFELLTPGYLAIKAVVQTSTGYFGTYAQGSTGDVYWTTALTEGAWYDVVWVISTTGNGNGKFFIGETGTSQWVEVSAHGPSTTLACTWGTVLKNDNLGWWFKGAIDGFKVWSAALTDAEAARERVRRPVRTADLFWWLPQITQTGDGSRLDYSGNGRDWTVAGTPSYGDGGPAAWGASPILVPQYAAASNAPVLSAPGVQDIMATTAVPKVTLVFS